jgi:hypothetical protein
MDNNIDIAEINRNIQESYIHYDPNRVDFTINHLELDLLKLAGSSIWKDVFLTSLGLGIPTLINGFKAYSNLPPVSNITLDIFVNLLVGGISIALSIICFIVWQQNKNNFNKLIEQIKSKPKYKIIISLIYLCGFV